MVGLGWVGLAGFWFVYDQLHLLEVYLDDVLVSKAPIYMLVIVELPNGIRFKRSCPVPYIMMAYDCKLKHDH